MNILLVFPHPDDAALCAAGTIARWVEEGHAVTAVCCTRGNMGTLDPKQSAEALGQLRSAELFAANDVLGVTETEFLDFPDGCLLDPEALRKELVRCVRQYQPDRLVTLDPWVRYEVHRDHQVVGQMAAEAAAFACFPLLHPEQVEAGFAPHCPAEVWFMGILGKRPNTFVSIKDQMKKKVDALLCFEVSLVTLEKLLKSEGASSSQELTMDEVKLRLSEWLGVQAATFGKGVGLEAAEAFLVQKCLPGHFENFNEIYAEMLGHEAPPPQVVR